MPPTYHEEFLKLVRRRERQLGLKKPHEKSKLRTRIYNCRTLKGMADILNVGSQTVVGLFREGKLPMRCGTLDEGTVMPISEWARRQGIGITTARRLRFSGDLPEGVKPYAGLDAGYYRGMVSGKLPREWWETREGMTDTINRIRKTERMVKREIEYLDRRDKRFDQRVRAAEQLKRDLQKRMSRQVRRMKSYRQHEKRAREKLKIRLRRYVYKIQLQRQRIAQLQRAMEAGKKAVAARDVRELIRGAMDPERALNRQNLVKRLKKKRRRSPRAGKRRTDLSEQGHAERLRDVQSPRPGDPGGGAPTGEEVPPDPVEKMEPSREEPPESSGEAPE